MRSNDDFLQLLSVSVSLYDWFSPLKNIYITQSDV